MRIAQLDILRCPATRQPLRQDGPSGLRTDDGSRCYPVVGGVPVLIADEKASIFTADEVAASDSEIRSRGLGALARRFIPSANFNPGAKLRIDTLVHLVRDTAPGRAALVLVIGGGELGEGMAQLDEAQDIELVETDVYLGPRVMVACDGHDLPFADATFDGVIIQAVLEHVLEPPRVVAEIHRVLKPSGVVYADTPFMQQVHMGALDFTRFTELGQRRLFRMFEEIDRGVAGGPGVALLWSARYFARSLPRRSATVARVLDRFTTLALFWLKYLDRELTSHRGATDAASAVYFIGRKVERPVPDRDIIAGYRGAMRAPGVG